MPSTTPKYYVETGSGKFLGIFVGFQRPDELFVDRDGKVIIIDGSPVVRETFPETRTIPGNSTEVPFPPLDGRDVWDGSKYIPHIEPPSQIDLAALVRLLVKAGVVSPADIAAEIELKG